MKSRLAYSALMVLLAVFALAAGCHTPNQGTSTVTSTDESTEPTDNEPVPAAHPGESADARDMAGLEQNVARPGSDYREIVLDAPDPTVCREMCDKQMRCMAFTYVAPDANDGPRCRLKHSIPDKVEDQACCVSGVNPRAESRLAQLQAQGFELDTDRPGHNFRSFEMDRPEPAVCQEACQNLIDCKAFTYVRPGHKGQQAYCHLKNEVSEKVSDQDCCISGLK